MPLHSRLRIRHGTDRRQPSTLNALILQVRGHNNSTMWWRILTTVQDHIGIYMLLAYLLYQSNCIRAVFRIGIIPYAHWCTTIYIISIPAHWIINSLVQIAIKSEKISTEIWKKNCQIHSRFMLHFTVVPVLYS